jgi:hypothetical protein
MCPPAPRGWATRFAGASRNDVGGHVMVVDGVQCHRAVGQSTPTDHVRQECEEWPELHTDWKLAGLVIKRTHLTRIYRIRDMRTACLILWAAATSTCRPTSLTHRRATSICTATGRNASVHGGQSTKSFYSLMRETRLEIRTSADSNKTLNRLSFHTNNLADSWRLSRC